MVSIFSLQRFLQKRKLGKTEPKATEGMDVMKAYTIWRVSMISAEAAARLEVRWYKRNITTSWRVHRTRLMYRRYLSMLVFHGWRGFNIVVYIVLYCLRELDTPIGWNGLSFSEARITSKQGSNATAQRCMPCGLHVGDKDSQIVDHMRPRIFIFHELPLRHSFTVQGLHTCRICM